MRVQDTARIIRWLERNPSERDLLLALCTTEEALEPEAIPIGEAEGEAADRKLYAERWLQAGMFGSCARCFSPVMTFPDLRSFDWPSMSAHGCNSVTPLVTPRSKGRGRALPL